MLKFTKMFLVISCLIFISLNAMKTDMKEIKNKQDADEFAGNAVIYKTSSSYFDSTSSGNPQVAYIQKEPVKRYKEPIYGFEYIAVYRLYQLCTTEEHFATKALEDSWLRQFGSVFMRKCTSSEVDAIKQKIQKGGCCFGLNSPEESLKLLN